MLMIERAMRLLRDMHEAFIENDWERDPDFERACTEQFNKVKAAMMPSSYAYRCTKCKGFNIQVAEWTYANIKGAAPLNDSPLHDNLSWAAEIGQIWCEDCGEHTEVECEKLDCECGRPALGCQHTFDKDDLHHDRWPYVHEQQACECGREPNLCATADNPNADHADR